MMSGLGDSQNLEADPEFQRAFLAAVELFAKIQVEPDVVVPPALFAEAAERGWWPVAYYLRHAELERDRILGLSNGFRLESLRQVAEASGDVALIAKSLATEVAYQNCNNPFLGLDQRLAQAVALLKSGGGSPLYRPASYVVCGRAYHRAQLWSLAEEMYKASVESTMVPVPECYHPFIRHTTIGTVINRTGAYLSMACEAFELDQRGRIGELIERCPTFSDDLADHVFLKWRREDQAYRDLMAALAGQESDFPVPTERELRELGAWDCAIGCHHLARAIRLMDIGRADEAADLAEVALMFLDSPESPEIYNVGLRLTALRPPVSPAALRYCEKLVSQSADKRQRNVQAAVARYEAEEVLLTNQHLNHMVYTDSLTGITNRRGYDDFVDACRISTEGTIGVILVDVDLFKLVNDNFGHAVGDKVLVKVAAVLGASIRAEDLAARTGGDEFVVIMRGATTAICERRCRELELAIRTADWSSIAEGLTVTASMGAASGDADQIDEMLADADAEMYARKMVNHRLLKRR